MSVHPLLRPALRPSAWASVRAGLVAAALVAGLTAAQAAPDTPPAGEEPGADAITQLLVDRGVLPAGSVNVMQSMRDRASDLVVSAMNFLGVPYRRGGSSAESGFDCSGFTRHIFEMSLGLVLPRRAADQANAAGLVQIPRDDLKPGDLVFFNTMRRAFSHVGIYIGDGKFIHSPRTGGEVRIEDMRDAYWRTRFNGARRAPKLTPVSAAAPAVPAPATPTVQAPAAALVTP